MIISKYTCILLAIVVFTFTACNDSTEATKVNKDTEDKVLNMDEPKAIPTPALNTNINQQTVEPAQNADGVWHYTCSQGCAGGAGSAVNCATCNNLLVHNAAYHPAPAEAPNNMSNQNNMNMPLQNMPEPPQNTAGVWHYTCQNGCSGGAGTALPCGDCGTILAHNSAYHQ